MARILLTTLGSLGDLHPALALALELQRRGHRAEIATSAHYREKITALGLPFHAMRPDIQIKDNKELVRQTMDGARGSERLLRDLLFPAVREMHEDLVPAAAGADLLVSSEINYAVPLLVEKTGIPWVSYSLAPISTFSIYDPPRLPLPLGCGWIQSLGPGANRLLKAIALRATRPWWEPVRSLRRELGLPPGENPLFEGKLSPQLDLAMFSRELQPPQPDWPRQTRQTGFPFFDEIESAGATLPPEVEAFLEAGEPPIVFTLGSAAVFIAGNFYAESARAAQMLGKRALLILGDNAPPANLPPSALAWNYLPYARIFPRAAVIVHQGGVGTTAQAMRAGRPMLVMPFAHDQPDNAARVTRLDIARTIARSNYTAHRAAAKLTALLGDPAAATQATAIGGRIRAEHGTQAACDALEGRLK